jgi:hypothetical protein
MFFEDKNEETAWTYALANALNKARPESPLTVPEPPTDATEAALEAMAEKMAKRMLEAQADAAKGDVSE